jgi:putative hydrolase of the HAD superfamily
VIRAILFDLDETLFDRTNSVAAFVSDQDTRFAGRLGESDAQQWCARFLVHDARGSVAKSVVYTRLLEEFGGAPGLVEDLVQDYRASRALYARSVGGMAETLESLCFSGLQLGIITNGETEFQSRTIEALGLTAWIDTVLISEQEGLRKPDRALFERAAARLGVAPSECIFVGDNPVADILGAAASGMRTTWFSPDATWPSHLPAMPGVVIKAFPEVVAIVQGLNAEAQHT